MTSSVYPLLTEKDFQRIHARNKKHCYGICQRGLLYYGRMHKDGTDRDKQYVEYLLTDINFHSECALLSKGRYDEFFEEVRRW